jgi:hypothetical protein
MVVDDQIVSTVGRQSMRYVIKWQGAQRLPDRHSRNACRSPQPRTRTAAHEQGFQ